MRKRTDSSGLGSLGSGALTALSTVVVSGAAAAVGIVIAREFGRTEKTDGLLAAYGLFIVIAIAAQAIRVALLPLLAAARAERRLAGEIAGFALALAVIAAPLLLVAEVGASELATLVTGGGSGVAKQMATESLRWIVPAAVAHLFAALAASALAALDDYGTAALGYAAGAVAGFTLIVLRAEPDGPMAVAWGMALNGAIALLVPACGLVVRGVRARMPRGAVRPSGLPLRARIGVFAVGAVLPLSMQLLYVTCLAFAGRTGTGEATTFVYAYLAASSLVTVTATSLGLVTSVPLTRAGLTPTGAARHVVATSWLAFALVGAAAGVFALAGGHVVERVLGGAYGGEVGSDLGRLVVAMSPWMIAAVGVTVSFPLAFVAERTRGLVWISLGVLLLQLPLAWIGSTVWHLTGLALALALSTLAVLVALLWELEAVAATVRGLALAAAVVLTIGVVAFGIPAVVLRAPELAGTVGLLLYVATFALLRPRGLVSSWRYLRTLG